MPALESEFWRVYQHRYSAWQRAGVLRVDGDDASEVAQGVRQHVHKGFSLSCYLAAHAITTLPVRMPAALSFGHTERNGSLLTLNGSSVPSPTLMTPSLASLLL